MPVTLRYMVIATQRSVKFTISQTVFNKIMIWTRFVEPCDEPCNELLYFVYSVCDYIPDCLARGYTITEQVC